MHSPCRILNPTNVYMKKKWNCKNHYQKCFIDVSTIGIHCFPQYRHYNIGIITKVRDKFLDNRCIVPHNPYLIANFDCYINVEICSTIKTLKYLYKYIYKDHDCVTFNLIFEQGNEDIDKIWQLQLAIYVN